VKGHSKSGKIGSRLVSCSHHNCRSRSTTVRATPARLVTAGIMVAAIVLSILPCCWPFDDPDDFQKVCSASFELNEGRSKVPDLAAPRSASYVLAKIHESHSISRLSIRSE
jgi:hypothetical protein